MSQPGGEVRPHDVPRRFGFTNDQWRAMVDDGYDYLGTLASQEETTDYTDVARHVGNAAGLSVHPHEWGFHWILGDIATRSYERQGVLLTAIVHYRNSTEQGLGFLTSRST